jgi:hypothetical protein
MHVNNLLALTATRCRIAAQLTGADSADLNIDDCLVLPNDKSVLKGVGGGESAAAASDPVRSLLSLPQSALWPAPLAPAREAVWCADSALGRGFCLSACFWCCYSHCLQSSAWPNTSVD